MSLLTSLREKFRKVEGKRTEDGAGGYTTDWAPGAEFDAILSLDTSTKSFVAESETAVNTYILTTGRDVDIRFHNVIQRVSDGRTYLITNDGTENVSPKFGSLDMKQCTAIEADYEGIEAVYVTSDGYAFGGTNGDPVWSVDVPGGSE